jgi:glycosyltransferase involved in cell wall biosynthesis
MRNDVFHVPVSLIIITYNKLSRLILTLESVKRADYIEETEIIIVDDGSNDGTEKYLDNFKEQNKDLNIKVIHIANSGRSVARNIGIIKSTGSLLIFMDDDLLVNKEFITSHCKLHEGREDLVVHGRIYSFPVLKFMADPATGELYTGEVAKPNLKKKVLTPHIVKDSLLLKEYISDNARLSKFENDIYDLYNSTGNEDSYIRWIGTTGGNISIQRKKILKIENFDLYMGKNWGCEDLELGFRAYLAGCQFVYSTEAANYHINHYREDFNEIHDISLNYFISKHRERSISMLKEYFNGNLKNLVEWKVAVDKVGGNL